RARSLDSGTEARRGARRAGHSRHPACFGAHPVASARHLLGEQPAPPGGRPRSPFVRRVRGLVRRHCRGYRAPRVHLLCVRAVASGELLAHRRVRRVIRSVRRSCAAAEGQRSRTKVTDPPNEATNKPKLNEGSSFASVVFVASFRDPLPSSSPLSLTSCAQKSRDSPRAACSGRKRM